MKKLSAPSKNLSTKSPLAISKEIGIDYNHVILHKKGSGFTFTVFWVSGKNQPAEPVATGPKTFKTKEECIKSIKKLYDATPTLSSRGYACYDHNHRIIDTEIKYDVRKLL